MIDLNEKPLLMIHEFCEDYLNLPLKNYILTFDDGLYTQYLFLEELLKLNTPMIFSISTNLICPEDRKQDPKFISCKNALLRTFHDKFDPYMKWNQIEEIFNTENCYIAAHGHLHMKISHLKSLNERVAFIKEDTEKMLSLFKEKLDFRPDMFCFPFNLKNPFYKGLLETNYGFKTFLGDERLPLEILRDERL